MSEVWQIAFSDTVIKRDIPRLAYALQKRICTNIEAKLSADPIRFGKPLRYAKSGQRSLRVGDYRVIYLLDPDTRRVMILAIGHRRDIYEG